MKQIYFTIKKSKSQGYDYYRIQKMVDGMSINVTGKTKKQVTEKFYTKLEELERSAKCSIDINNISVADFVAYYLFEVVEPVGSIRDSTFLSYRAVYNSHIKDSSLSSVKFVKATREDYQYFFNAIFAKPLKMATIKYLKNFISTAINYAVEGDLILKNQCRYVKFPKVVETEKKHKFLTDDEVQKLLANCDDEFLRTLIFFILNTGLRINEALALNISDVDFDEKQVTINKTVSRFKTGKAIAPPKTKSGNREIPINDTAIKVTKSHVKRLKTYYLQLGIVVKENNLLFPNRYNKIKDYDVLVDKLNKLYEECEIETRGFHTLRHTYGSKLYESGVDIKTISELLGHGDINITNKIYLHLNPEKKVEAVNYLNFKSLKN